MEEQKKNNKVLPVLIIIILLIITGLFGYYMGINSEKELANQDDVNKETDNNSNNENVKKYIQEDIENIIENNLNALLNKTSLEELTNQERLRLLISLYPHYAGGTIAISDLKEIHQTSVIKNLDVTYTDVYDYYTNFSSDEQGNFSIAYKYDEKADTLTYTGALGHGGGGLVAYPIHKELVSFEENNNEYTIKYKYVFGNNDGDGPAPYTLYYSGIDAYNRKNAFKKFTDSDCVGEWHSDCQTPTITYIEENYDNIKEKLLTYTYTFKIEDKDLVITSFSVSK